MAFSSAAPVTSITILPCFLSLVSPSFLVSCHQGIVSVFFLMRLGVLMVSCFAFERDRARGKYPSPLTRSTVKQNCEKMYLHKYLLFVCVCTYIKYSPYKTKDLALRAYKRYPPTFTILSWVFYCQSS
jgi:choline-glycine betaine transporter